LRIGHLEECLERLKSFFASIPNKLNNKEEKHYQTIFYLFFRINPPAFKEIACFFKKRIYDKLGFFSVCRRRDFKNSAWTGFRKLLHLKSEHVFFVPL